MNGALTGTPGGTQTATYPNIVIRVSASASQGAFSSAITTNSATLSWTAPTQNTNITALANLAGYTINYSTCAGELN